MSAHEAAERGATGGGAMTNMEREMAEKPARCKCLHTQRSHAFCKTPKNSRRVSIKRLGECLMPGCPCQQFVRAFDDSLDASERRHHLLEAR